MPHDPSDGFTLNPLAERHRLLHYAIICFALPYFYSYFNEQKRMLTDSVEEAMLSAFDRAISQPSSPFRKAVVGFNCDVDLIVPGVRLMDALNISIVNSVADHDSLSNLKELAEAFHFMFQKGAAAERFMSNEQDFKKMVQVAEKMPRAQYHIGGNAALSATRIATAFPWTEVHLVGPIGPRSQALLHPSIKRSNSTRITKDEIHVILEYKQGEVFGDHVALGSSRFITSHDLYSSSTILIEMFFKAIATMQPDLVIITGVHLLEFQQADIRLEKLRLVKRNIVQIDAKVPIHLKLGGLGGDREFAKDVLERVVPYVDSLTLTEQQLALLAAVGGGPHPNEYPVAGGALHAHKVVDMVNWLLTSYGKPRNITEPEDRLKRLSRVHFTCLTFHVVASVGNDWSNLAAGLAGGARLAGRLACGGENVEANSDLLESRTAQSFLLDSSLQKFYQFDHHHPLTSWLRDQTLFLFTPVLVCKYPRKTVGIDDATSVTALLYSQFYRFEQVFG
ncbi:unnamed protein product, partial [Mesorhabditis spiculigera]